MNKNPVMIYCNTDIVRAVVVVIVWLLDLQLPMKAVLITTNVVSSNLEHNKNKNTLLNQSWCP